MFYLQHYVYGRFPSNYTSEEGDNEDPVHTYAMAENVLDIVVSIDNVYNMRSVWHAG